MFLVHSFAAFGLFTSCMYYLFMKRNFQVWGEKKKKNKTSCMASDRKKDLRKILKTKVNYWTT